MSPRITSEQLAAHRPGEPLRLVDEATNREFWLVAPEDLPTLWADNVRAEVQRGVDAISRGDIVDWNPDAMKEIALKANQASRGE